MKHILILATATLLLASCNRNKNAYDATGTFEAVETIVSADANGTIKELNIEEGQELKLGQQIGYIDSTQLYLKKKQMQAQIKAVLSKKPNIAAQISALEEQLKQAEHEQKRVANLFKSDAATQKQVDDANAQVAIFKKQILAQESTLGITTFGINEESLPVHAQMEQLDDQLRKCKIINPINGTVLTKYAVVNEMAATGKAIYKIADLSSIILRVYITDDQFSKVKINQKIKVLVDDANGSYKNYEGFVEWISNKAEFTPKTIQTKDERANLVYAIKVKVKNDGLLKIGMYGEVKF